MQQGDGTPPSPQTAAVSGADGWEASVQTTGKGNLD